MFIGRFEATLSDGQIIKELYPDEDSRPGYMGWKRLGEYLQEYSELCIESFAFLLRDKVHQTLKNADGYFANMRTVQATQIEHHRGFGCIVNNTAYINWFDQQGNIVEFEIKEI